MKAGELQRVKQLTMFSHEATIIHVALSVFLGHGTGSVAILNLYKR